VNTPSLRIKVISGSGIINCELGVRGNELPPIKTAPLQMFVMTFAMVSFCWFLYGNSQRKDIDTEGYVKTPPSSLFGYTLLVSVADF
jgi:hypothetical protein